MYFISRPLSQIASTICVSYDAAVLILYNYKTIQELILLYIIDYAVALIYPRK